jgi:hypothetical protein
MEKQRLREYRERPENRFRHVERGWRRAGAPDPTRPRTESCEICGAPPGRKALALDHDHRTGRFRGWLCLNCNHALGKIGDSLESLIKWSKQAERYLRKGLD